jgi:catechol 2,3-dioxygenase-like lactoylglutathione lyase family enzyme
MKAKAAFSGFSVDDLAKAEKFYTEILDVKVDDEGGMGLQLHLPNGGTVFVYSKDDHQPATFTILNFVVDDIDEAVKELKDKGVTFEHYDGMTDEDGIARGIAANRGPDIAWFKDPAGNIVSVLQDGK